MCCYAKHDKLVLEKYFHSSYLPFDDEVIIESLLKSDEISMKLISFNRREANQPLLL